MIAIPHKHIKVRDNLGRTLDRYHVNIPHVGCFTMSHNPGSPQGVCTTALPGEAIGVTIPWNKVPYAVQSHIESLYKGGGVK